MQSAAESVHCHIAGLGAGNPSVKSCPATTVHAMRVSKGRTFHVADLRKLEKLCQPVTQARSSKAHTESNSQQAC